MIFISSYFISLGEKMKKKCICIVSMDLWSFGSLEACLLSYQKMAKWKSSSKSLSKIVCRVDCCLFETLTRSHICSLKCFYFVRPQAQAQAHARTLWSFRSVHVSLQFYSNKRIFDYVRLKINSSLRCCLFFFLSHIRIRIRFLHCFVVRLFLTFVSSAMWWMERVKRPVLCTFTVHPSVPCCFCFRRCCFCSCSKLFGRFKCVRCAHTHTYISYCPFNNVCLYFEIGSQTLQQRVTQTNAWGNAFRCVSLTMSKSPVFRCCRVAQYSM